MVTQLRNASVAFVIGALLAQAAWADGSPFIARSGNRLRLTDVGRANQYYLTRTAGAATGMKFASRNNVHAKKVGQEAGMAAALAAGVKDVPGERKMQRVFTQAARRAGAKFAPKGKLRTRLGKAFFGSRLYKRSGLLKKLFKASPQDKAGPIARRHLYKASAVADGRSHAGVRDVIRVKRVLKRATLDDVAQVVARNLGLKGQVAINGRQVKADMKQLIPKDDWAYSSIDPAPTRAPGAKGLSGSQLRVAELGLRMANTTWKSGQVHRAAAEGKSRRIDPAKSAYGTFAGMMVNKYNGALDQGYTKQQAFNRVVFEAYKDLAELRR